MPIGCRQNDLARNGFDLGRFGFPSSLLADRVAMLSGGKLIALGTPNDVLTAAIVRETYDVEARIIDLPDGGRLIAAG